MRCLATLQNDLLVDLVDGIGSIGLVGVNKVHGGIDQGARGYSQITVEDYSQSTAEDYSQLTVR